MRNVVYPELEGLIAKHGYIKSDIAKRLGITHRHFTNKLKGRVPFTWDEAETLHRDFFPNVSKEEIMQRVQ